ncbi:MAG: hypothetical protein ABWX65_05800 [Mycetocola sp.]
MASLVQQRMAIERRRSLAVWSFIAGGVFALLAVGGGLAASSSWMWLSQLAIGIFWTAYGLISLRRYRREIAVFTAEHGAEAGRRW